MENKRCDTIMKNQRSIYQCMGKYIFAIIRSIIAARYFKSEKRDWRLFSSDLMRKRRVPGGEKWTHGLQMEVIDVIEAFTDELKGVEATDTGNIIKYACRWKKKNGIQDLEKILWYTQHLIDHLKNIEEENK